MGACGHASKAAVARQALLFALATGLKRHSETTSVMSLHWCRVSCFRDTCVHMCFWPSALRCRPEQQPVGSAGTPWCGSAGTVSVAPPPQARHSGSARQPTASLRDWAEMRSSSSTPPLRPLLQNEGVSCNRWSPKEEACPPPPPAYRCAYIHLMWSV